MKPMIPLDLLLAVRNKGIRFRAWAHDSFRKTLLHVRNDSTNEILVDISRSGLTARTGQSQTIGLSYPVASQPGEYVLVLEAGQEKEFVFNSRCLNKAGREPKDGMEYKLVPDLLAHYVSQLLRQGADQQEVWKTIADKGDEIKLERLAIPAMVDKF